jgi:hypothetical protein
MAGAFKSIATKNITRHIAHKSYEVEIVAASGSFSPETDLEVFVYHGAENTGEYGLADTATTNGYNKRDIYSSINTNFYKKVEGPIGEGGGFHGHVDSTFKGSLRLISDPFYTDIRVISIPHLMIGDGIKPGSVRVTTTYGAKVYVDDLNGNVSALATGLQVGNVFYTHGIIVLNSFSALFDDCTLEFKNTHVIEEHEYMCNASKHEFNATTNHSILSDIASGSIKAFASSSAFNPYVTSVGLYDDVGELLVVGKLGQAIKKSEKYDTSYVIRFDT